MKTLQHHISTYPSETGTSEVFNADLRPTNLGKGYFVPGAFMLGLLTLFLFAGPVLQSIDPAAGILDVGILSVLFFGILGAAAAIFVSLWLQELLWQPFKTFRQQFLSHFNQLTSWQQSILYFSVFFLLLYAFLMAVRGVF